jgi:hypothetical protein
VYRLNLEQRDGGMELTGEMEGGMEKNKKRWRDGGLMENR